MDYTNWINSYIDAQCQLLRSLDAKQIAPLIELLRTAHTQGKQIFVFGNGGNAASASHFVTDLGKGSSDVMDKRFKVLSLNDNVSWITALGNDYSYEDVFQRQLENYAQPGDVVICGSVSGNSPNCVKAMQWAREQKLNTVAFVGAKQGELANIAEHCIVINDTHYGRVEDAQMTIYHLLAYAFMEDTSGTSD